MSVRVLLLAVGVLCLISTPLLPAQKQNPVPAVPDQQPQGPMPLSAEESIRILQNNPDLLAEAKARIASELRARGYNVSETDITDDRLFSEIREDDRVRAVISDELQQRGFTSESDGEQATGEVQQPATTRPATGTAPSPQGQTAPPAAAGPRKPRPASTGPSQRNYPYRNLPAVADLYTQAVVDTGKLERFGASLFRNSTGPSDKGGLDVPVGPDYTIGTGDELIVQYWGSASQKLQLTVNREGQIALPEVGTIMVSGRSLGNAQELIQQALSRLYRHISVDVSLGKLRTVRVYVVGDVVNPGAYDISSLSTPLNALLAAGGPTDHGSLRLVKHFRGRRLIEEADLYDLMLNGVSSAQTRVESGDSILVPPVGPQVTVAGMVRRPAIYELRGETTLAEVLQLVGGVPVSGELRRIKVERVEAHERKRMLDINLPDRGDLKAIERVYSTFSVKDGDYITVAPILPYSARTIYLQGHVFRPGKYPFKDGSTVMDLVSSFDDLLPEPADRAEIVRLHPPDNRPFVIGFNLREVLNKEAPPPKLQPFDTLRVFGRYDSDAPKVAIYGEVLRPGEYPLSERMTAADLVSMAGGFKRGAFTQAADLASYDIVNGDHVEIEHREVPIAAALSGDPDTDVALKPGDVLTIRQLGGWTDIGAAITVSGEIAHPGRYGIQEGERLSSILKRAGGFRDEAYPYGAILERAQVREISVKNRDELIRKLQLQTVDGSNQRESLVVARQRQALIDRLKQIQPSGRLVIHITPQIEKWANTAMDIEVRPGDTITIPKRPNFILVAGQVYNPTAITFSPGRNAGWYVKQAGGPTGLANKRDVFVIRANGSVVGHGSGDWLSGTALSTILQPGDTVYIPEKVTGPAKLASYAQMAQVLSGVAIAAHVAGVF